MAVSNKYGHFRMKNSYRFFQNKSCKYFPCKKIKTLNCLFCYCPIYQYKNCGGNYTYINKVKDCSRCLLPHKKNGYNYIINFIKKKNKHYEN